MFLGGYRTASGRISVSMLIGDLSVLAGLVLVTLSELGIELPKVSAALMAVAGLAIRLRRSATVEPMAQKLDEILGKIDPPASAPSAPLAPAAPPPAAPFSSAVPPTDPEA